MKRFIVVLVAAVCCLTSCFVESETDCIYHIGFTHVGSMIESGISPSEGETLIQDYKSAFSTMTKSLSNEWTITVKNNRYSSPDAEAKAEYEAKLKEVKAFNETWQKKFDAYTENLYKYSTTYVFFLYRFSGDGKVDMAEESFDVNLNFE